MNTSQLDIVYFLKDSAYNDELKYSLRSVEKNFPHKRVVFYGGRPCGVIPDKQVLVKQQGKTKWDRVRQMYSLVCEDEDISDPFVLFNDDFFVMQSLPASLLESLPAYYYGALSGLIFRIEAKNRGRPTPYTASLKRTEQALKDSGYGTFNYELHLPMVFYKDKLKQILEMFPDVKGTRSLHGNVFCPPSESDLSQPCSVPDVKIVDRLTAPKGSPFLSTNDESFRNGLVGKIIRSRFQAKSRFERR